MLPNNCTLLRILPFKLTTDWNIKGKYVLNNISSSFDLKELSTAIRRVKDSVVVKDDNKYKRITIKTNGGGVTVRDTEQGVNIRTKSQYLIKTGQLAISKIDARNGAIGIVPAEADNAIITGNFWVYDVDESVANIEYLKLMLSSNNFTRIWEDCSNGSGNRLYLQENKFLAYKVPLPNIDIQIQLVSDYRKMISQAETLEKEAKQTEDSIDEYLDKVLGIACNMAPSLTGLSVAKYSVIDKWGIDFINKNTHEYSNKYPVKAIADVCKIGSGGTPSRNHPSYYKGQIPWVKTGEVLNNVIMDTEEKITPEAIENSSAKLYPENSLIIAMYGQGDTRGRTAKLGISATTNQACAVLHNIDENSVLTDYLWFYLQGEYERLREKAYGNNQPNLTADIIKNHPLVIPPIPIQREIIAEVIRLKDKVNQKLFSAKTIRQQACFDFENSIFSN